MENKTCLITGCSGGIGKQVAMQLAKMNFTIIMVVRDSDKSRAAFKEIRTQSTDADVAMFYADLASRDSIIDAAEKIKKKYHQIDVLINNAGVVKRKYETTAEGHEMTFAVNYLAPFLLTSLLLPLVESSPHGRIINLASELYKKGQPIIAKSSFETKFNGDRAYANSKMLIVLFTKELARRLENRNVSVNCVHPGVVATDAFREYPKWISTVINLFVSKPEVGANPIVYLATSDDVEDMSGEYFNTFKAAPTIDEANDLTLARRIWETTESLLNPGSSAKQVRQHIKDR